MSLTPSGDLESEVEENSPKILSFHEHALRQNAELRPAARFITVINYTRLNTRL